MSLGTWVVAFLDLECYLKRSHFGRHHSRPFLPKDCVHGWGVYLDFDSGFGGSMGLSALVSATGLTMTDRLLGMVFGAARGALVVTVAVAWSISARSEVMTGLLSRCWYLNLLK